MATSDEALAKEMQEKMLSQSSSRVTSKRRSKSMELMQTSDFTPEAEMIGGEGEDEDEPASRDGSPEMPKPSAKPVATVSMHITPAFPKGIVEYSKSKEVLLSKQGLVDADAVALVGILEKNVVAKMVLANNDLGDAAAARIGEALKVNTSLTYLSLHANLITATGITALAAGIQENMGLKTVFLTGMAITPAAEKALTEANAARTTPIPKGLNGIITDEGPC